MIIKKIKRDLSKVRKYKIMKILVFQNQIKYNDNKIKLSVIYQQ